MRRTWSDGIEKLPRVVSDFELDRATTALIIVDMQEATGRPDSALGQHIRDKHPAMHTYYYDRLTTTVVPNQIKLLDFFREQRLRVIYLALGSMLSDLSDYTPLRQQRRTAAGKRWVGSEGYQIFEPVRPLDNELVLNKTAANAFNSSTFERTVRNMGIECLVFAGVISFGCVFMTAADAADRGFRTAIVEDASAGWDEEHHNAALRLFATIYGNVVDTDTLCAQLAAQA